MRSWSGRHFFPLFPEKDALRPGVPEASPDLNPRPGLAVKAGIGGFHPAVKQLAGKACNGVPTPNEVFCWEPCKMRGRRAYGRGGIVPKPPVLDRLC